MTEEHDNDPFLAPIPLEEEVHYVSNEEEKQEEIHPSISESGSESHHNPPTNDRNDNDRVLVVPEDRYVNTLSFIVLVVLAVVSILTTKVIHNFSSGQESSRFENEYDAVAKNLIERLRYEVSQHLFLAQGLATVIVETLISKQQEETSDTVQDAALTLQFPRWEDLTRVPRITGALRQIAWNPLVYNVSQQLQLEQSIRQERRSPSSYLFEHSYRNPPCFLCDNNPLLGYINRDDVDVENARPGQPAKTCGAIDDDGRQGMFLPRACPNLQGRHSNKTCICGPVPAEAATPVDMTTKNQTLNLPSRLFFCNATTGALELWNDVDDDDEEQGSSHPFPWTVVRYLYAPGVPETVPTTLWVHNSLDEREAALRKLMRFQRPLFSPVTLTEACAAPGLEPQPRTTIYAPVSLAPDTIFGVVSMEFLWSQFLTSTYPPNSEDVEIVVESSCSDEGDEASHVFHTFVVEEQLVGLRYRGSGDLHERRFSEWQHATEFVDFYASAYQARPRFAGNDPMVGNISTDDPFAYQMRMESEPDYCNYRFLVYPTTRMERRYLSPLPFNYALASGGIFLFTSLLFVVYVWMVKRRQEKVMETAKQTNDIVVSLFPPTVRDRLYQQQQRRGQEGFYHQQQQHQGSLVHSHGRSNRDELPSLLHGDELPHSSRGLEPIADFFPHTVSAPLNVKTNDGLNVCSVDGHVFGSLRVYGMVVRTRT